MSNPGLLLELGALGLTLEFHVSNKRSLPLPYCTALSTFKLHHYLGNRFSVLEHQGLHVRAGPAGGDILRHQKRVVEDE